MLETDMSKAGNHEWICLYHSSSILEPCRASDPASQVEADSPKVARMNAALRDAMIRENPALGDVLQGHPAWQPIPLPRRSSKAATIPMHEKMPA